MNFALSEDNEFLRRVARDFVENEIDLAPLLVPGATGKDAHYEENWEKIVAVGWPGLIIPEEYNGSGMSCVDLAMVVGEMGRGLTPSPFLGTLAATWTLLKGASEEQKQRILPKIASGAIAGALAVCDANGDSESCASDTVAIGEGDRYLLNGRRAFVVDAAAADVLVVEAELNGARRFFLVDAHQPGVEIDVLPWRDLTRQVGDVRLQDASAEVLPGDQAEVWPWVRDRLLMVLSTENAAGLSRVLETTVAYAKERVAYGRPIGAFQAIKHQLAEMFGASECANVAALYAAWALSADAPNASDAAAIAKSYTSEAYVAATHRSIQIFGAIGFSWEMKNHLFFKRARANALMFGQPRDLRKRLISILAADAA